MLALKTGWGSQAYSDSGGRGLPVLFLHGTGCNAGDWRKVIATLPGNLRAITMDFRAHGASDVPANPFTLSDLANDILRLADHLGLEKLLVIGHSLGGMVAMTAAMRSPRVAGLVLLEGWTSLAAAQAFPGHHLLSGLSRSTARRIQRARAITRQRMPTRLWNVFWKSVEAFDGLSFLKKTRIPVIEAYGSLDRNSSTRKRLCVPVNAQIRFHWIAGAGHFLPQSKPSEIASLCVHAAQWTASSQAASGLRLCQAQRSKERNQSHADRQCTDRKYPGVRPP